MGNAAPEQRARLRAEISEMEGRLLQMSIANATSSKTSNVSKAMNVGSSKLNDFLNEMHDRNAAQEKKTITLLPEVPKLSELQKAMFANAPAKELYKKSESGK